MTFGAFQGLLRPLVEAAWRNHAGLLGVSVSDKAERDAWYRDNLWASGHLKSSKHASERQRDELLAWFSKAGGIKVSLRPSPAAQSTGSTTSTPSILGWSTAQAAAFWKLAAAARHAAAQRAGEQEVGPLEGWVLSRLAEPPVAATTHTRGLLLGSSTEGFDLAMSILAIDAGDMYWIDRTSASSERRLRYQLERFLVDISWLESETVGWSYAKGIHVQAHHDLPDRMEDCTAQQLFNVLQILDTQIRRLCARWSIRPCFCPTRPPADPVLLDKWRWYHNPRPGQTRSPDGQLLIHQQKGVA